MQIRTKLKYASDIKEKRGNFKMSALRKKIFKREGEGILKPKNTDSKHTEIPVKFTCAQYRDGVIDGTLTLIEENHTQYMELFRLTSKDTIFSINTNLGGEELNIEPLYISNLSPQIITFIADYLKLKHREISSATNKISCRFDVSNLKSINTTFEIEEGKVTFFNYEGDIWKDIEIYKKSGITGCVQIELNDEVRLQSIEVYKSLLFNKINKILRLASLSQGTYIDWASFELFEQNNEGEYERVYSERRAIPSAFSVRHELTSYLDLSNYFRKNYPNYTDNLDTDLGFSFALEWYLESLNRGLLESKYLGLFTVLETFIYRFATTQNRGFILDKKYFNKFKKKLEKSIEKHLSTLNMDKKCLFSVDAGIEEDLNNGIITEVLKNMFKTKGLPLSKNAIIKKERTEDWIITDKKRTYTYIIQKDDGTLNIYEGIGAALNSNSLCLNRYSFKNNLIMFLGYYKIGYSDITDIEDLGVLIEIRNKIIHRGISERDFDDLIDACDKLMALVQRIFLAFLNYEGSYRNQINKNLEPFKKDPNNDWIGQKNIRYEENEG